ncbi:Cell morphogenesis protein PAG1 [Malassezia brasiliensis]|uniref:Cell morphogenesis protein PAG1 n=1 Tax=Malassezia brasiliensis TaxID=1821822 RepID=A0AAF0DQX0_9BASI|nr:Cell morphogenesis protein PAG1 [Malassezia brasiliensis]
MDDEGQVVIPDLDDAEWFADAALAPPPPLQSPGTWSASDGRSTPVDDARRLRTPTAGAPSGDAARYGAALDYFATPPRTSDRTPTTPFSFPVKKSSFASLRAAIKGQSTHDPMSPEDARRVTPRGADSAASGLAQVTGLARPAWRHAKSASQASASAASAADADVSFGAPSLRSPSRGARARQHTRHGSHFSEQSLEAGSLSPNSVHGLPPLPGSDTFVSLPDATGVSGWALGDETSDVGAEALGVRRGALVDVAPRASVGGVHTPLAFALEQVLRRFGAAADDALAAVLHTAHDVDAMRALFPTSMHAAHFDAVLDALGHMARHSPVPVMESLLAWRAAAMDVPVAALGGPTAPNASPAPSVASMRRRGSDAGSSVPMGAADDALVRRKGLAVTYVVSRALLHAVPERVGAGDDAEVLCPDALIGTLFHMLHLCSMDRANERVALAQLHATLQQQCFDTVARVLGAFSRLRLAALGDQFVQILRQSSAMSASRDHELLTEAAILGMRYVRIAVYPMEQFEEGAELVAALAQFFAHSHGYRIKRAFARVLCALLLPVASTASAERHHPTWEAALHALLPKAQQMAARARYWSVAQPLWTAALCAAPPEVLLAQWSACLDAAQARVKDRGARPVALQCATQLLHAYLFHCHEGTNATYKRLDAFFAQLLTPQRGGIAPSDAHLEPNVAQLHYVLFRQFEYGRDKVLELLRHTVFQDRAVVHQPELLQPTRMRIAVRAVWRTAQCYATGEAPPFPHAGEDEGEARTDVVGAPAYPSAAIGAAYATFFEVMGQIALIADYQVKDTSVFDPRTLVARGTALPSVPGDRSALDREQFVVRTHVHGAFTVVYAREQQAYLDLLRACFDAWPLCASPALALPTMLTTLFRAQYSAEPALQRASAAALLRIARQSNEQAHSVVRAYLRWAIRQDGFVWELVPHAETLLPKLTQTIGLFIDLLDVWWMQRRYDDAPDPALDTLDEIEGCAVYLLCAPSVALRQQALTVLRLLAVLHDEGAPRPLPAAPRRIVHLLEDARGAFLTPEHPELSASQRARVARWDASAPLSALCTAGDAASQALWQHALPALLEAFAARMPASATAFYVHVLARVKALDAVLGSSRTRAHATPFARRCWRTYTAALCAATALDTPDVPRADVVPLLVPYLGAEDAELRDAAAHALGYTQPPVYVALLAALQAAALPVHEETRLTPARVQTARVVYLTAPRMPPAAVDARAARLVGAWVQDTLTFLQARAGLPTVELCALRRYFAATVGHYYGALGADAPHYLPSALRVELFTLLDDWHSVQDAQRLAAQLSAAAEQCADARQKERVIVQQRHELHLLAAHAERAMAALCAGPLVDAPHTPLAVPRLVAWVRACLSHADAATRAVGAEALRALLRHNGAHPALLAAVVAQSFADVGVRAAPRTFFAVLAPCYVDGAVRLADAPALALALVHVGHADADVRAHAVAALATAAAALGAEACVAPYAVRATSAHPGAYLAAQHALAHALAARTPRAGVAEVLARHLADVPAEAHVAVLEVLAPWVHGVATHPAPHALLTQLALLTHTHGDAHPLAVRALWAQALGAADGERVAHYAMDLALGLASAEGVVLAQRIVACADAPEVRASMCAALCTHLRPAARADRAAPPEAPASLAALRGGMHAPPLALAPPLAALLLLSECVGADAAALLPHLPVLLHALCVHLDGLPPALHAPYAAAADQVVRAVAEARGDARASAPALRTAQTALHAALHATHATDAVVDALCTLVTPLCAQLRDAWAAEALHWAAADAPSLLACRSLQVLRVLHVPLHAAMLAELLARLAACAAPDAHAEAYTTELLHALRAAMLDTPPHALPPDVVAALGAGAAAAATTPHEAAFAATVALLHTLLDHPEGARATLGARPPHYDRATPSVACVLLRGLRSVALSDAVLALLARVVALEDSLPADDVVAVLVATLPWSMQACDARAAGSVRAADARAIDPACVTALGEALAHAAERVHRADVARVAHSIARARFRSADELARQAAACAAALCVRNETLGAALVARLCDVLHCACEWVARQALRALGALLDALRAQQADGGMRALGTRLLDPVLAQLATPLAPLALDVLDRPALATPAEDGAQDDERPDAPAASGWGVPNARLEAARTQHNLHAVVEAFDGALRAASADGAQCARDDADELGALAVQLDDLATFFGQDDAGAPLAHPHTEHVAKILARSTYRARDSMLFAAAPPPLDAVLRDVYADDAASAATPPTTPPPPARTPSPQGSDWSG